jgi:hypothetical protein
MKLVQTVSLGAINQQKRVEFVKMKGPNVIVKYLVYLIKVNFIYSRVKDMLKWLLVVIGQQVIVHYQHQIH